MKDALLRNRLCRPPAGPSPRDRRRVRPILEALETRLTPSVTFAAQQTIPTGSNPQNVVAADLNCDGRPDLVISNGNAGTLSVLENATPAGTTTPTFAAQQTFAVSTGTTFVAVGDFNGDGKADLAVVGNNAAVAVLLNTTPDGSNFITFATPQTFAVGSAATGVAAGDFNGDGRPDLAVTDEGGNTVSVLLNTTPARAAAASFAAQQTFAVGNNPFAIVAADFNGDGRPDLAVINNAGGTVSVLMNTTAAGAATASFATQQVFAVGASPRDVVAADFNGDGRPDLAVTNQVSNTVSVLLDTTAAGAATPSFAAQQTFAVGSNPYGMTVADLDGDGRPDLAVATFSSNAVSVLVNTTSAGGTSVSFTAQQTFAAGSGSLYAATGAFTGDGRPDLAVTSQVGNDVSVLPNTTTPFPTTLPVTVAQFGTTGVWELNRVSRVWQQLTPANATRLATDPLGDVAAEFQGYGVWEYRPSAGWKQLNGVDASLLAIDVQGDIVAEFPGYGVGEYALATGWRSLTPANAALLAVDALGDVAADFPGYGVELYRPTVGWKQINGVDANLLAMDPQGDIVANFPGYGVGEYKAASGWQLINGTQALALSFDARGDVEAVFQGYGTNVYTPLGGWRSLAPVNSAVLAVDTLGDVFGEFTGNGIWEYDVYRGWAQLSPTDATLLAVG
jgi:hypothetical protein